MHEITSTKRYPFINNDLLQAWDSADELLLTHLRLQNLEGKRILILNDRFGALSCGLSEFNCVTYTDSFVSAKGIESNSSQKINAIHDLADLQGTYDVVLIQIPKNMSFFEDQLAHLSLHLHPESQVICASMVKHLAPKSFELLHQYIGKTTTSLAEKKARLIFCQFEKEKVNSPYPMEVALEGFEKSFVHHSNLFSREKLDIGTRFFLEHLPKGNFNKILDLGCANGIIGIKAKLLNPKANIVFSDDSWMAIKSATKNYQNHFSDHADYVWTNCFEERTVKDFDLVLCNPPFHQQNTIGDFIALQMFNDSFAVLQKGGKLLVIGNSHLNYQQKMKKIFGNSKIIATNKKFVICESMKL